MIFAVLALAGLREREALGLLVSDIDLERRVIHVRRNEFRRLKTKASRRPVPIFSQLLVILSNYLSGPHAPKGELLVPSPFAEGPEAMLTELRKAYDKLPMPSRLRRRRTDAEFERAEAERINKLERKLGKEARTQASGVAQRPREADRWRRVDRPATAVQDAAALLDGCAAPDNGQR